MTTNEPATQPPSLSVEQRLVVWQVMASRRSNYDTLMWQTPALGMTAQAFLLTLALDGNSAQLARLIAALLSLVLSVMTMQLMRKHRHNEVLESRLLTRLEEALGLHTHLGFLPHSSPSDREALEASLPPQRRLDTVPFPKWLWAMSSYRLWMYGLFLFAVAAITVMIVTATGLSTQLLNAT